MRASTAVTTLLAAALLSTPSYAEQRDSVGFRIGQFVRNVDRGIQRELDDRPNVRRSITGGIDVLAENLSDAVTPEADNTTRRLQRNAVQMMLNPSNTESNRAFEDMTATVQQQFGADPNTSRRSRSYSSPSRPQSRHNRAADRSAARSDYRQPSGPARASYSEQGITRKPQTDLLASIQSSSVLQANWHHELWQRADAGIVAVAEAVHGGLPKAHAKLTGIVAEAGVSHNTAAALATSCMILVGFFGLYVLFLLPRRGLKRKLRRAKGLA